jgi:hypothetical protein
MDKLELIDQKFRQSISKYHYFPIERYRDAFISLGTLAYRREFLHGDIISYRIFGNSNKTEGEETLGVIEFSVIGEKVKLDIIAFEKLLLDYLVHDEGFVVPYYSFLYDQTDKLFSISSLSNIDQPRKICSMNIAEIMALETNQNVPKDFVDKTNYFINFFNMGRKLFLYQFLGQFFIEANLGTLLRVLLKDFLKDNEFINIDSIILDVDEQQKITWSELSTIVSGSSANLDPIPEEIQGRDRIITELWRAGKSYAFIGSSISPKLTARRIGNKICNELRKKYTIKVIPLAQDRRGYLSHK